MTYRKVTTQRTIFHKATEELLSKMPSSWATEDHLPLVLFDKQDRWEANTNGSVLYGCEVSNAASFAVRII